MHEQTQGGEKSWWWWGLRWGGGTQSAPRRAEGCRLLQRKAPGLPLPEIISSNNKWKWANQTA